MEQEDPRMARSEGRQRCLVCGHRIPAGRAYTQLAGGDPHGLCIPCWDEMTEEPCQIDACSGVT